MAPGEQSEPICPEPRVLSPSRTLPNPSKRLLRKFEENEFEKVERLIDLHMTYLAKVQDVSLELPSGRGRDARLFDGVRVGSIVW
jgi:hypothetical protein